MRFWDSSAIVPLIMNEVQTGPIRELVRDDPDMCTWVLTPLEILSALWRRVRSDELGSTDEAEAVVGLQELGAHWSTIIDIGRVERRARRLIAVHPLRAADSLQLAAALVLCNERPEKFPFVTLDHRLSEAARKEGFTVFPPG